MNNNKFSREELRSKILKGLHFAMEKLIRKKQQQDGEFVFSQNGKIVVIKAKDLKAT